jgi:hypothetical protein
MIYQYISYIHDLGHDLVLIAPAQPMLQAVMDQGQKLSGQEYFTNLHHLLLRISH